MKQSIGSAFHAAHKNYDRRYCITRVTLSAKGACLLDVDPEAAGLMSMLQFGEGRMIVDLTRDITLVIDTTGPGVAPWWRRLWDWL